jgi:hypothetical protein
VSTHVRYEAGLIGIPWEDIDISDAVNTGPRAGEPITVPKTYLKNTIETFGLFEITYTHRKKTGKLHTLQGTGTKLTFLSIRNVF